MSASTWSATCCTDLRANTSGWRFASSTVLGSSGQPAVTVENPACWKCSAQRSQLLGSNHRPCTNTTGFFPDAFAAATCSASYAISSAIGGVWSTPNRSRQIAARLCHSDVDTGARGAVDGELEDIVARVV